MLKIRPAEVPPQKAKISFKLPQPTIDTLESYLSVFQKTYGVEPDRDFVVNQILTAFFASDREFTVSMKNGNEAPAKKKTGNEVAAAAKS
jgi:hypothetical protein